MRWVLIAMLLAAGVLAPARAGVVIYRCTDHFGAVTVQNDVPCPKGSRQQKQVIEPPPPMPAYRPPPAPAPAPAPAATLIPPAAPASADAATQPPAGERLPPPPLFQCNTYDGDRYLSDDGQPQPRCAPLQVTGVDGSAGTAAGSACQMVSDQCERVADGAACDAWKRRAREAEAAWRFGRAEDAAANEAEFRRIATLVRDSSCGG